MWHGASVFNISPKEPCSFISNHWMLYTKEQSLPILSDGETWPWVWTLDLFKYRVHVYNTNLTESNLKNKFNKKSLEDNYHTSCTFHWLVNFNTYYILQGQIEAELSPGQSGVTVINTIPCPATVKSPFYNHTLQPYQVRNQFSSIWSLAWLTHTLWDILNYHQN